MTQEQEEIQKWISRGEYERVYDKYAALLDEMLLIQKKEEWLDFIAQEETLEEQPLVLYLSAQAGECLCLGGYEGDVTEKILSFLSAKLPKAIWEPQNTLKQRICIDMDERNGELDQQLEPYQKLLNPLHYRLETVFDDTYCAGVFFLFVQRC